MRQALPECEAVSLPESVAIPPFSVSRCEKPKFYGNNPVKMRAFRDTPDSKAQLYTNGCFTREIPALIQRTAHAVQAV
jgi:hypothetical protein